MGQQEVYEFIKDNPRLCSREIAEALGWDIHRVCKTISKMIDKEIEALNPTTEELERILYKFPTLEFAPKSKYAINRIKVFRII